MCSQSRHPLLILTSLNVPHTRVFSSAAKTLSGGRVRSPRCFSLFRLNSCESNVPGFAPKARARTCPASRASRLPAHAGVSHLVRNSRERRFRVWAFSLTFLDFARSTTSRTRGCFAAITNSRETFRARKAKNLYHTGSSTNRDSSVSRGTLGTRVPQPTRRTEPARRNVPRSRDELRHRVTLDGCPAHFPRRRRHFAPPESLVRAPRAARRVMADVETDLRRALARGDERRDALRARRLRHRSRARGARARQLARAVRAAAREDGDIDESFRVAFKRYFATDYVFVEDFINLLARALASAPTFAIKARLGRVPERPARGRGDAVSRVAARAVERRRRRRGVRARARRRRRRDGDVDVSAARRRATAIGCRASPSSPSPRDCI